MMAKDIYCHFIHNSPTRPPIPLFFFQCESDDIYDKSMIYLFYPNPNGLYMSQFGARDVIHSSLHI